MARLIGEKDISGILSSAESWIQNCIVRDGAVFSLDGVWTKDALNELHKAFIDNPLEDDRSYFDKLKVQISDCSVIAKRLMAELLWVARLFPSNIGSTTKRRQVIEIYGLSGETLSPDHPMLSDRVLYGVGSAGPGYNNHFWREIAYIIELGELIKGRDTTGRQEILGSYDEFVQWIAGMPQSAHRQFSHMLRYFAFPDIVERMSSSRERRNVIAGFRGTTSRELKRWSDLQLDEEVLAIRKQMEASYPGQTLDFYRSPLRERWITEEEEVIASELSAWLLAWNPNRWAWEKFTDELARSARGEPVVEKWSCSSKKVEVGDEVWLVRLGVEPRAVCGHGSVTREPYDAPHWDTERKAAGEDARYIEVSFDSLRDPDGPDAVRVTELARHTGQERRWTPQQSGTQIAEEDARVLRALWDGDEVVPITRNANTSLASVERNLSSEHVRQALAKIDSEGIPPHAKSTGYDLIDGSKRYPPKLVLEISAEFATGSRLDRSTFSGGESSKAVKILRDLGFDIESKSAIEDLIRKFLSQASTAELATRDYPESYRGLALKVSFGKGNVARIPWIALLAEGEAVSKGIYPVLLFFKQQNTLLLCYGISEENEPTRKWALGSDFATVSEWFQRKYGEAPDRYGDSFVKAAFTASTIDFRELTAQLDAMISEYRETIGEKVVSPSAPSAEQQLEFRADLAEAVSAFAAALNQANVSFGASHSELVQALLASLTTKPFAILTGLSGSGKTQIAIRLGEWLGRDRLYVAAVRPDWTGAEAIFGYEDGLRPAVQGRAAWAVTGILEFILKATRDKQHPYLLVLDEMNLAHVERYFADVLSGMESRQECLPHITKEADGCWRVASSQRIQLPKNLWIIGTVNVDETTYMFSPKVLDRANVFEFRVVSADLMPGASKPHACTPGDAALIRGLHSIANDDRYHKQAPPEVIDPIAAHLRRLHELLSRYGLEFGHRTFYEALRFASLMSIAGVKSSDQILDRIVIQKLLPRLHGSRRRLELPLLALAQFSRDLPEQVPSDDKLTAMQPDQLADRSSPKLASSYEKVVRMLRSLRANQFASFTE